MEDQKIISLYKVRWSIKPAEKIIYIYIDKNLYKLQKDIKTWKIKFEMLKMVICLTGLECYLSFISKVLLLLFYYYFFFFFAF